MMSTTDQFRSIAASPREQLAASISSRPVTRKQASEQKLNHVTEGQKAPFRRCSEHFSFAPNMRRKSRSSRLNAMGIEGHHVRPI